MHGEMWQLDRELGCVLARISLQWDRGGSCYEIEFFIRPWPDSRAPARALRSTRAYRHEKSCLDAARWLLTCLGFKSHDSMAAQPF